MLKVVVPENLKSRQKQIKALMWQLAHDLNDKDREIHLKALEILKGDC